VATQEQYNQTLVVTPIRQPLHGWLEVLSVNCDSRIYLLRNSDGWFIGLASYGGGFNWAQHGRWLPRRIGPFSTREEVEAAFRLWFLDNPFGPVATLLARHPWTPGFRPLLLALNSGDVLAGLAFNDLAREVGCPIGLVMCAAEQLAKLGIWPSYANGNNLEPAPRRSA
jgi:hypothetical protein